MKIIISFFMFFFTVNSIYGQHEINLRFGFIEPFEHLESSTTDIVVAGFDRIKRKWLYAPNWSKSIEYRYKYKRSSFSLRLHYTDQEANRCFEGSNGYSYCASVLKDAVFQVSSHYGYSLLNKEKFKILILSGLNYRHSNNLISMTTYQSGELNLSGSSINQRKKHTFSIPIDLEFQYYISKKWKLHFELGYLGVINDYFERRVNSMIYNGNPESFTIDYGNLINISLGLGYSFGNKS